MDNDLEYILSLAHDGKYDEARKAAEALDIPETKKATINMQIWQIQRKAETAGYDPERIPKTPVISMIIGFILIISAAAFKDSVQSFLVITGLILAGAVPAYYCIKEKRLIDKVTHRQEKATSVYTEEDADINFSRPLPPTYIIAMGVAAAVSFILGVSMTNIFKGTAKVTAACIFFLTGFILLYLCCKKNRNHNAAVTFMLLSVSTLLIFIYGLVSLTTADSDEICRLIFLLPASLILLLFPVFFRLVKRFQCTEAVEAECLDILCEYSYLGHSSRHPKYHAIWKYSYNGTVFIHKDMASYKSPVFGETTELLIDPRDPHNTYRRKAPVTSAFFIAAGLYVFVCGIGPLLEKLTY